MHGDFLVLYGAQALSMERAEPARDSTWNDCLEEIASIQVFIITQVIKVGYPKHWRKS